MGCSQREKHQLLPVWIPLLQEVILLLGTCISFQLLDHHSCPWVCVDITQQDLLIQQKEHVTLNKKKTKIHHHHPSLDVFFFKISRSTTNCREKEKDLINRGKGVIFSLTGKDYLTQYTTVACKSIRNLI